MAWGGRRLVIRRASHTPWLLHLSAPTSMSPIHLPSPLWLSMCRRPTCRLPWGWLPLAVVAWFRLFRRSRRRDLGTSYRRRRCRRLRRDWYLAIGRNVHIRARLTRHVTRSSWCVNSRFEISSFRQSRNKHMFNLFRLCRKDEISFDIVTETNNIVAKKRQHSTLSNESFNL